MRHENQGLKTVFFSRLEEAAVYDEIFFDRITGSTGYSRRRSRLTIHKSATPTTILLIL
jgi:hypothetical protein